MRAARKTTVEMRRLAMYRASLNRCWTSSTDSNMRAPLRSHLIERSVHCNERAGGSAAGAAAADHPVADLVAGCRSPLRRRLPAGVSGRRRGGPARRRPPAPAPSATAPERARVAGRRARDVGPGLGDVVDQRVGLHARLLGDLASSGAPVRRAAKTFSIGWPPRVAIRCDDEQVAPAEPRLARAPRAAVGRECPATAAIRSTTAGRAARRARGRGPPPPRRRRADPEPRPPAPASTSSAPIDITAPECDRSCAEYAARTRCVQSRACGVDDSARYHRLQLRALAGRTSR